jgi:hypothetical protein
VQDVLTLIICELGRRVVAAEVRLDHERALLSEKRKKRRSRRHLVLVLVYNRARIREFLPKFTFFDGQLVLRLGHGSLDLGICGFHGSRGDERGRLEQRDG